jgi:hypothetical protein
MQCIDWSTAIPTVRVKPIDPVIKGREMVIGAWYAKTKASELGVKILPQLLEVVEVHTETEKALNVTVTSPQLMGELLTFWIPKSQIGKD